jgi:hypothetical protein
MAIRVAALTLLLGVSACTGVLIEPSGDSEGQGGPRGPGGPGGAGGPGGPCVDCGPGTGVQGIGWSTRFARLTHPQWENTTRDLLRLAQPSGLSSSFAPDPLTRFDTSTEQRKVSAGLWSDYQKAAETLAGDVSRDAARRNAILPANLPAAEPARGRSFVSGFGRRAFRRALTSAELDAFSALYARGPELLGIADSSAAGVEIVVRAMLQSPNFIYRVEVPSVVQDGKAWLSDYELASRLSYTLWNTMPSDQLLDAAEAGELTRQGGVEKWAKTLLDDPRAAAVLTSFHEQLFRVYGYGGGIKDANLFPSYTRELEPLLQAEARLFFDEIVSARGGGIRQVLTSTTTYVNAQTAPFYGLTGAFGTNMQRADLDPSQRAGILTQLGFLSTYGGLVQPDPIHRGVLINLNVLCVKITAPNMVPPLPEPEPNQTNRERIEQHTSACGAGCHDTRINPVGFAFENFDTVGSWRTVDSGKPVDARSSFELDGKMVTFNGAAELAKLLAESPTVHECYAANWLEYVLGRPVVKDAESVALKQIGQASQSGVPVKELLAKIAVLDSFRARPVEVAAP